MQPKFPWELIQLGNCGSPIEIDEGWLVLTHGVGAMRQYSLAAILLDKANPAKVIGRLSEPMLTPIDATREGYVPNVVYTCGAMKVGERLLIPYGVADSSVRFASAQITRLSPRDVTAAPEPLRRASISGPTVQPEARKPAGTGVSGTCDDLKKAARRALQVRDRRSRP